MLTYKQRFIQFMVENEVLLFGDFTLKSGRKAPYFINAGKYRTGTQIAALGEYYAECFLAHNVDAKTLIGPAYKGIPLAVATAIALAKNHGVDVGFCFDRKEVKDHGEGGMFVGQKLEAGDKVAIIEDVMTSGKALREVLPKIRQEADVTVSAMIISVDRQEKGTGEKSAVQEAYDEFGVRVYSIVTVE
ncbi:MAG TPA: orotate phosphoribosyltransferase, partial [Candidatus Gallimonas intestinigallinarum]|nr:orotate phosphoribosyltransferase [Candidatus Gallimonas intestinigallinarum]